MRRIKDHTLQKLGYFKKYIEAYLKATKKLPIKYYIDAFAGTGKCILCNEKCDSIGGQRCIKCGRGEYIDGSALISLKASNKFNGYVFIELSDENVDSLNKFILEEIEPELVKKVKVKKENSNLLLKEIYKYVSNYNGCLIFLDLVGPELEWETVVCLSKIKKAELLILYPYDMSIVRLINDYPDKLNKFYGTSEWSEIYKSQENFDAEKRKTGLLNLYVKNLKNLGFEYVVYKQIRRKLREGKALYHLILATHHPTGKKIMEDIFGKELDNQMRLMKI